MEWIFVALIWFLLGVVLVTNNTTIRTILVVIQLILFIIQIIYIFQK